jgi:hypothetical protein
LSLDVVFCLHWIVTSISPSPNIDPTQCYNDTFYQTLEFDAIWYAHMYVPLSNLSTNTYLKQVWNITFMAEKLNLMHKDMPLEESICVQLYVHLSTLSPNTLFKLIHTHILNKCQILHPWPNTTTKSLVKSMKIVEHKCFLLGLWS